MTCVDWYVLLGTNCGEELEEFAASIFIGLRLPRRCRQQAAPVYGIRSQAQACTRGVPHVPGQGKVLPRTGLEVPEGEEMYTSNVPSTSALDGGMWSTPCPGRFNPGKDMVPIVQEAGWAPGPVWTGAKNLAPTGI